MKLSLINICFCIFLSCNSFKSVYDKTTQADFNLEIKQFVSGSYTQQTFVIVENVFFIFQNTTTKEGQLERKKIYSKRIEESVLNEIKQITNSLLALESKYIKAELGGIRWEIILVNKDLTKKIIVENYSVKEIEMLFNLINKIIPNKKPVIYKY